MRHALKLRVKMTTYYTILTALLAIIFCVTLYSLTSYVLRESLEREVRLTMAQVIAQLDNENGMLSFSDEVPIPSTTIFFITEENGSEIVSFGEDITFFEEIPIQENVVRNVRCEDGEWLLMDSDLLQIDGFVLQVRVATSCVWNNRVLSMLSLIFCIGVPLMVLVAAVGGYWIAKRSLHPIRQIIHSAEVISQGKLSERIPVAQAEDELGELTDTLNRMLASVQSTFEREKRFTTDASHELRTPVAVIRAYTESLLADQSLTGEQHESLTTLHTECLRMQNMIGQMLTLTRGQEGRYAICPEAFSLEDVCDSIQETLSELLIGKQIYFKSMIPVRFELIADQSLISQMLLNLVENAIKYGKPGGDVIVSATVSGVWNKLTVKDNGIGIPPESLPHIFERFYRVEDFRDRDGTGLGLSIVQWIVETHSGKLEAESVLGEGTIFTISLPRNGSFIF